MTGSVRPLSIFTTAERRLIERLRTPLAVQRFLNALNTTPSRRQAARRFVASVASFAIRPPIVSKQRSRQP